MARKTAVAAPAQPPHDELLVVIDRMTIPDLVAFTERLKALLARNPRRPL